MASVLAASMLLSMVQIAGFAAGRTGDKTGEVVNGAFVAGEGVLGGYDENASKTVSTPGGKVTVTKSAEAVACPDGNQFEVTLQVVTKDKISETISTPDAAVTLVIDVSGSMDDKVNGKTKMAAAIDSAKAFLASLKENTPTNSDGKAPARYVSVVAFSGKAQVKCEWQDIMTDGGYRAVESAINGLKANGGTNLQDGFIKANTLMQTAPATSVAKENRFTVLLSDGCPETYNGEFLDGNPKKRGCEKATEAAGELKKNSNAIYSVYYGKLTDICYNTGDLLGIFGKDVTINDFLKTFSNNIYSAENADQLTNSFENISNTIALLTKAWEVSDPMGPNVKLEEVLTNQGTSVAVAENTLTWKLREDVFVKGGTANEPTYTYTLKYLVTVDASGEGWTEDAVHPLNDYTFLRYAFYQDGKLVNEDGTEKADQTTLDTIGFNVPGVKVERPERPWRIEYYKQAQDGSYTLVDTTKSTKDVDIWTQIKLEEKDPNYASKYNSDNYKWVKTDNAVLTVSKDGDNVIKVYYDRKTTSAVVNYHYELTTIFENGQKLVDTDDVYGTPVDGLFVGEEYSVEPSQTSTYGGYTYSFDHAAPNDAAINALKENGEDNVIDLYYVKEIDYRKDASVEVEHVYRIHTWVFDETEGKWKENVQVSGPTVVETAEGLKVGEPYLAAKADAEGYEPDPDNDPFIRRLTEGKNTITLYFDKYEGEEPAETTVVVNHHYVTRTATVDENGNLNYVPTIDTVLGETETGHVGDRVAITGIPTYDGNNYTPDEGNLEVVVLQEGPNVVNLYYVRTVGTEASIKVTHEYFTIKHVIETEYDENGEVIGTKEHNETYQTEADTKLYAVENIGGLYDGQLYTAQAKYQGYTPYDTNEYSARATADGKTTIALKYYRLLGDEDTRDNATIGVTHKYITHMTTLVLQEDGTSAVEKTDVIAWGSRDEYTGKKGETYVAVPEPNYKGDTYNKISPDEKALTVVMTGKNKDIEIVYEREAIKLPDETNYTVDYVYNTYRMTVGSDGVARYGEPQVENGERVTGNGYVGQIIKLDPKGREGFEADAGNPSPLLQELAAGKNEFTFVWNKYVPLDKVNVTVNHHYTTVTIDRDGTEHSNTEDVPGSPIEKYIGERYIADAREYWGGQFGLVEEDPVKVKIGGVEQKTVAVENKSVTVTASGDVVIDFYYTRTDDNSKPINYSIRYEYYDIDFDDSEKLVKSTEPITGSSFAGKTLATTPVEKDDNGYKLTSATFNGTNIMGQTFVTLVEGTNEVVYVYKRTVDTRPTTSVKVIHEYYASANAETPAFTDEENFTKDLRVPSEFKATPKPTKNDVAYTRTTGDGALTITLVEDAEKNVITIKYVRTETSYTVVHEYYTNGNLTGSSEPQTIGGTVGATITADSIAKVTSYNGNTYTYTSATGAPLTLVQGENGTITLRYDRTTTPDRPDPIYYYTLTINYVDGEGNAVADPYRSGDHSFGWNYSVTSPEVEGMTPDQETVSGILTRNTTITVVYTAVENVDDNQTPTTETPEPTESTEPTETPEPVETQEPEETEELEENNTPLTETPDVTEEPEESEELEENDTPLAEVPQTGDSLGLWIMLALCSAAGLAWIVLTEKKGKRVA